jgi:hypothetical protein
MGLLRNKNAKLHATAVSLNPGFAEQQQLRALA